MAVSPGMCALAKARASDCGRSLDRLISTPNIRWPCLAHRGDQGRAGNRDAGVADCAVPRDGRVVGPVGGYPQAA